MRIAVNGFGRHADTLHIDIPRHAKWEEFRDILSISGVTYYYTQAGTIGVRYNDSVNPIDVAAQALIVTAAFCKTPLCEVEVTVKERVSRDVNEAEVAAEVQSRMLKMSAPAEVSLDQVVKRGQAPAYYLG